MFDRLLRRALHPLNRRLESGALERMLALRAARPEEKGRRVTITATREPRLVRVTIADEGKGFDWRSLPDPREASDLLSLHGRGVLLSRLSVDDLSFNERGDVVTVEKKI